MTATEEKAYYFNQVTESRLKRDQLPLDSPLRFALSDDLLAQVEDNIRIEDEVDLRYGKLPPIYGFFSFHPIHAIKNLDAELQLVIQSSNPGKAKEILQFLNTSSNKRLGDWYGGLFDLWAKATAVRSDLPYQLDYVLPNGRDHDIRIELNGRFFHLENTAITRDDEAQEVWDRYCEAKKLNPEEVLLRPGKYCPPNSKGPSPYYLPLRLYGKIYDKITKNLDPTKSQCAVDAPNILLLSFSGPEVYPDDPGVGWVLDEIFADQPRMVRTIVPDSFTDISLDGWVDYRAKELIHKKIITINWYCENSNKVISAPRQLSGILLFDDHKLVASRVNYNADKGQKISHAEMSELEMLFRRDINYWL